VQAFPFLIHAPYKVYRFARGQRTAIRSVRPIPQKRGKEDSLVKSGRDCWVLMTLLVVWFSACEQAKTEQSAGPPPAGVVERTVQETIDGIKGPMDKARGVEGTLGQAAERTAEQASQAAP